MQGGIAMDRSPALPGKPVSLWLDTALDITFPTQSETVTVDVAVIGGGIVGVTAASLLKAAGRTVALIDAGRLLQGVTGQTTAKLTALQGLIYDDLQQHFGEHGARLYAEANQAAIELIQNAVTDQHIDCDFLRTEAYTYADREEDVEKIKREVEVASRLGLPVTYTESPPLPFPVRAAIRCDRQAQFHPVKYLQHMARQIPGEGSHVFEGTCAERVEPGDPCVVTTRRGTIRARDVVLATHYPFIDHSLYAVRLRPHRSYALAARLQGPAPRGMHINVQRTHSLRAHSDKNGEYMIIVGEGHPVGEGGDTREHYRRLEAWAREVLPVASIDYHWSTHDHRSIDHVPYVGRLAPLSKHVHVATGFGGWGMTNGTVAGLLLRDLITGVENPWAGLYDPNRLNLAGVREFVGAGRTIATHLIGDRLRRLGAEVETGEGKVIATAQGRLAVYRDDSGELHAFSPACTHMGCVLQFNGAEKSWDCPCHGSRFAAIDGRVLHGPAIKALTRHTLSAGEEKKAG
jgi:glycine/D-amino acid oxidase-like deaminating enzyme/nitrite reductase/ring-hydroxylating ferredoxin subunit